MSKSGVRIDWGGLTAAVGKAAAGLADAQILMARIGAAMKAQTVRRFQAGEGPDGAAWAAVKNPRRDTKGRKRKGKAKPLLDTARLRNSISFSAAPGEVHVGSNVEYARIHQLGGQAGRGRKVKIPARPYLGVNEEDAAEIKALVVEHIAGSFKR